jgi:hypothetical protein
MYLLRQKQAEELKARVGQEIRTGSKAEEQEARV